jgi:hypothetical protein
MVVELDVKQVEATCEGIKIAIESLRKMLDVYSVSLSDNAIEETCDKIMCMESVYMKLKEC